MPPFRFRLATLLRLRVNERDERRTDLSRAMQAAEILEQQRQDLLRQIDAGQELTRQLSRPGEAAVDRILESQRFGLLLKSQVAAMAIQQQQVAEEVERRRLVVVEADRQVRVLEKLAEKQLAEHQVEESRADMKDLDEQAAVIFSRQEVLR